MASALPSFISLSKPICRHRVPKYPQVRSQIFSDEGRSANMVDANLSVLRERMEELRKKERDSGDEMKGGWTYYKCGYNSKCKRKGMLLEFIEVVGLVSSAVGLVFLSGSLFIFLVSLVVHLYT